MKTFRESSIFLLVLLLFIVSCEKKSRESLCDNFPLENSTLWDTDDYEIMNAVLRMYYPENKFVNIIQQTDTSVSTEYVRQRLISANAAIDSSMLVNFELRNANGYFLDEGYLDDYVHLINRKELQCLFSTDGSGWERYYQKYDESNGYLIFSMPGINADKNKAILVYSHECGALCGSGFMVLLERKDNKWVVTDRFITWIS